MIEIILPSSVVSADAFDDVLDGTLFPEEEAVIGRAVDKRRREFTTARLCARKALRMLGRAPVPILPGARGEPQWPAGVVGSITHCAGYRGAVLGEPEDVSAVGIDAEPNETLPNGVLAAIALPKEQEEIHELLRAHPGIHWDRLLFSAKESVYKAWFPLTNQWLSFENALITIDPLRGTFSARLLVGGPQVHGRRLTGFSGRWLVSQGLILTAIVMPTPVFSARSPRSRSA
ncbi:4'-phosphopantetheinyl transferase EntD [Streptosporangium album]|uniref:4'-phosphopantetheinyl transferase EntD n=1 Tax=Streptosporangium album TaxID=47479 RepID=A0A7W7S5T0_9ACTN|nr:4'-phosphopantetheinyl transferase superfamily protein [Streptosporangium album]MBB4944434.1 4'-phosphopantetheinyl transferase EntD [Streptosporangium album]